MNVVHTSNAVVELIGPGMVACRYLAGAKVTAAGIAENIAARLKLVGDAPHVAITILSAPEDFDMTMLRANHYAGPRAEGGLHAQAMVADGAVMPPLLELYFAYFPTRFPSRVFATEAEAMAWLRDQQVRLGPQ